MRGTDDDPEATAHAASERWAEDPTGAEATLSDALHAATRVGVAAHARARMHAGLGQMRIFLGRIEDALRVLYDALDLADDGYVALQLGNALAWRGDATAREEAEGHVGRALTLARRLRDGPLAIGALCARGELLSTAGRHGEAVAAYGEALGIGEFTSAEGPTIAPLAGLARAHAAGRAPGKAGPLAERALERARRLHDAAGEARALAALAAATHRPELFEEARAAARSAPHRPLALRCGREGWKAEPSEERRVELLAEARSMGLAGEAALLRAGAAGGSATRSR